ncbi:MAG: efflux RND transporter permease subunit, partial [Planctomycetota bacterium]
YPGASPSEVELEVTDRLEKAIQELPALDTIYSLSKAGLSIIKVDIKQEYWSDRLPQVWDEMRSKIRDVTPMLPPGCQKPDVGDDFSFVYGFVLAVTGDGFSYAELEQYADHLKKELSLVSGVSRVELWGVQQKAIYLDAAETQLAGLGLSAEAVMATLTTQNKVVDAGSIDRGNQRFRMAPTGTFKSPEEIGELVVRESVLDTVLNVGRGEGAARSAELLRIRDIATVRRGYLEPPMSLMRYDGQPALAISLANVSGGNIVDTGAAIDKRLEELIAELPVGLEVHRVAWQSDLVSEAVMSFLISLAEAVGIVLVVLTIPMGLRMGIIIGSGLVFTILGTFIVMSITGVDLQRMSLGALVIALGMMVDNSIVVADGIMVRIQGGMDRKQAAIEGASKPSMPLLGATVIATMAFYPIFASVADAGEYCRTLFTIVGASLMLSWLFAITLTPVQCMDMLPQPKGDGAGEQYGGRMYGLFRGLLRGAIKARFLTIGVLLALLVLSLFGFGGVKQMFFPESSRLQFMIDYWAPEGTRIQQVSQDLKPIERKLLADKRVAAAVTFVGQGPPRFYLPVDPEMPYESYAQIIVNTHDLEGVRTLTRELKKWVAESVPEAMVRVRQYGVGVSETWPLEVRFTGPAQADLATLRRIGKRGMTILEETPLATDVRIDMRQRVVKLVPDYDQARARWAVVSREDIARAAKWAYDGLVVGLYREGDKLQPIILRNTERGRRTVTESLETIQVRPVLSTDTVPLSQVTKEIRAEWEDPIIVRWNRRRAVTVQCTPHEATFPSLYEAVVDDFEEMPLPPGYQLEWQGEYDSSKDAQDSLVPGVIPAALLIVFIIVALFNAFRPPLIILLTIPFAAIGITAGLLGTGAAFGFVALLGAMSLAGMMIKNSIVLLDEVNANLAAGKSQYEAVVEAAVSRLRPVALAAATTVLGVIPLLQDVFWVSMAVTIMAGLAFGTILTMVLVPLLYATLYRLKVPPKK